MDIRQLTGFGGVERNPERTKQADRPRASDAFGKSPPIDGATISTDSRDTASAVDALVERAEREEPGRRERLALLEGRLESGELASPEVVRATAKSMIAAGFPGELGF